MKKSFLILCTFGLLLVATVSGAAISQCDPPPIFEMVRQNAELAMGMAVSAPVIVSSAITPQLIEDLKLKFGQLKLITVVVEAPVYDIDNIPFSDRVLLKQLGVDYAQVLNTELTLAERLKPLETLLNDESNAIAKTLLAKYKGEIIEPGEQYQFLAKRPDRTLIKLLLPLAESKQIDDFADKAVKNLIIGGDTDKLDDGIVFMGVVSQLRQMISPEKSFLSKA